MKKILLSATLITAGLIPVLASASPEDDRKLITEFMVKRFPGVELNEFSNGVYAIDEVGRQNWEAIEEFPPYEPFIDEGEEMWNTPFANGKGYKDCFPDGPAIANKYPHWDKKRGMVVTLPLAINECLQANGEKPLAYKKGKINSILAYLAYKSRGQITNVEIPKDDPRAMEAYEKGKQFYFARRGQLNFSCATCSTPVRTFEPIRSARHWATPPTGRSIGPNGETWAPCTAASTGVTSRSEPSRSRPRARSTVTWSTS